MGVAQATDISQEIMEDLFYSSLELMSTLMTLEFSPTTGVVIVIHYSRYLMVLKHTALFVTYTRVNGQSKRLIG
jgi:cell division protein FtsL